MKKTALPDTDLCPVCGNIPIHIRRVVRANEIAVCGNCGSWYRVPRPGPETLNKIYDKKYYNSWGLNEDEKITQLSKRATFTPLLRRIKKILDPEGAINLRILDVGAATGMLLETANEFNFIPYATEVNDYSVTVLRQLYGSDHVFAGELTDCPFADGYFHVVTMTDVIEHVTEPGKTFQTAARLLGKDGVLCITTPRIDSLSRRVMGGGWLHFKEEHIQYFSRKAMAKALRLAGFSIIKISPHYKFLTLDYIYRQLLTYPHRLLTPVIRALHRILPAKWRNRPLRYCCGEMLVIARKAT